jgi:hypothetical protein
MKSIQECRALLGDNSLTDEEIRAFRDGWYNIITMIIDQELGRLYEKNQQK